MYGDSAFLRIAGTVVINSLVKACELKSSEGCFTLGMVYEGIKSSRMYSNAFDSMGIKNYNTAKDYYDKACKLGNKDGCESAARLKKAKGL